MEALVEILTANPLANGFGMMGALLGAVWPLLKSRRGMLWGQAALHVLMCLHFYYLGAYSASIMNILGLGQVLAALPLGHRPGFKKIYIAYLPLIAIGAMYTWAGPVSLFAALGIAALSLSRYQTDVLKFRVYTLLSLVSWTIHDAMVLSIPALMLDALSAGSLLFMVYRGIRLARNDRVI